MLGILIAVPYTYLKVLCDYKKKTVVVSVEGFEEEGSCRENTSMDVF